MDELKNGEVQSFFEITAVSVTQGHAQTWDINRTNYFNFNVQERKMNSDIIH